MINLYLLLTFILFSLGQLGRISFQNQQINGYLYEVLMFIGLLVLIIKYRLKPLLYYSKIYSSLFIFSLICLVSLLLELNRYPIIENFIAFLYCLRIIFYFSYFIYLSYLTKKRPEVKHYLIRGIWVFIFMTLTISFIQYFLYPDLRNLIYQGWDPHLYRVFGSFFDTSLTAAILGLILLFILNDYNRRINNKFLYKFKYPLIIVNLVLIVLTFSRSVYIFLISTLIILFIKRKYVFELLLLLICFILILALVPKPYGAGVNLTRTFSINSRIADYKKAINLWIKKPIFGYGYNRIRYIREETDLSHAGASFSSSFLIVLVTLGILGLLSFIFVLYQLASISFNSFLTVIFAGGLSLVDNIFLHPFVLYLFLITMILEN